MRSAVNLDDILRCPRCHGPLASASGSYECQACRVRYPVHEGVANFVPSDAEPLDAAARGPGPDKR